MRTKEEIKAELVLLGEQRTEINTKLEMVKQELAECLAEFNVGQRVIGREGEYEIVAIQLRWADEVGYTARKVLKSGALHKNTTSLYGSSIKAKEQS